MINCEEHYIINLKIRIDEKCYKKVVKKFATVEQK